MSVVLWCVAIVVFLTHAAVQLLWNVGSGTMLVLGLVDVLLYVSFVARYRLWGGR